MSNKIHVFPRESSVTITITAPFYARLSQMLIDMTASQKREYILKMYDNFKDNDPTEPFDYHYLTLLTLVDAIEKELKASGNYKEVELPATDDQILDEDSE